GTWGVGNEIIERGWIIVCVSLKCYKHYLMYLPGFGNYGLEIENHGYWICWNLGTFDEVFHRPLAGLVCTGRTCHRRTSIEDSVVCAGELSSSWTTRSLATLSIEDSSMWTSQTMPRLDCFPDTNLKFGNVHFPRETLSKFRQKVTSHLINGSGIGAMSNIPQDWSRVRRNFGAGPITVGGSGKYEPV
ncbi:unnamed protein product, partial [Prunus brigantina]